MTIRFQEDVYQREISRVQDLDVGASDRVMSVDIVEESLTATTRKGMRQIW